MSELSSSDDDMKMKVICMYSYTLGKVDYECVR